MLYHIGRLVWHATAKRLPIPAETGHWKECPLRPHSRVHVTLSRTGRSVWHATAKSLPTPDLDDSTRIRRLKGDQSQATFCRDFGVSRNMVSTVWKQFMETVPVVRRHGKDREPWSRYQLSDIVEKDHYGRGDIMIWAGIIVDGYTDLHVFDRGTLTSQWYKDERDPCIPYQTFHRRYGPNFILWTITHAHTCLN
ncbi:hypothetical protein TNCV_3136451 [Trichonephila clavipes]|nr:hypothetical protein TNCV_3136451 [Trichonephila clavipes]